jgi:phosphoribosylglycinamide formyltransferase 1
VAAHPAWGRYTAARMKNIVILISGRGSNMQAIVQTCTTEGWDARIAAVISNRSDAPGLAYAKLRRIATAVVDHRAFALREDFDAELTATINGFEPDLLVLAGFMRILTPGFVRQFEGRLINLHPSLLPAFPGLHTHRRALRAGCKLSGATVHFVTPELDHGPIIAQAAVPVLPGDTETILSGRVLAAEHVLYPRVVGWLVGDWLQLKDGVVTHKAGAPQLLL